ncbi:MAG: fibronectin type III domain-containing protein [candidate division Zixibacteria bacterium]|nr:fibronectin type III domain-containing protein [candidate division Zixibacteria bacterium]
MTKQAILAGVILVVLLSAGAFGQDRPEAVVDSSNLTGAILPAPVTNIEAKNHKYDDGERIDLFWEKSVDDPDNIFGYKVYRIDKDGASELVRELLPGTTEYFDEEVENDVPYQYIVAVVGEAGEAPSEMTPEVMAAWEFFNFSKLNILILGFIVCGSVLFFISSAKSGKKLFIRKIGGLEALEEAVGRATEMGRPILFIPGILDLDDVQTLAAITILGKVSRVIADYDSKILMPVSRSLVMTSARETIKESYMSAGRPDGYNDNMVQYITDEQFGYVAAVNGIMVREKPATCLYLGAFFAESLILAETGNSIGAIQIAGTARPGQLPFFVAACDYTLIGEELFAASAYLSGDPKQLGSLKGQDIGKIVAMSAIILGTLAMTFASAWELGFMQSLLDILNSIFVTN